MYKNLLIIQLICVKFILSNDVYDEKVDNFAIKVNPKLSQVCFNHTLGNFEIVIDNLMISNQNNNCYKKKIGKNKIQKISIARKFNYYFSYTIGHLSVSNLLKFYTTDRKVYIQITPNLAGLKNSSDLQCYVIEIFNKTVRFNKLITKSKDYLIILGRGFLYYTCKIPKISTLFTAIAPIRYQLLSTSRTNAFGVSIKQLIPFRRFIILQFNGLFGNSMIISILKLDRSQCLKSFRIYNKKENLKSNENSACKDKPMEDLWESIETNSIHILDLYKPLDPLTQYVISIKIYQDKRVFKIWNYFMTPIYNDVVSFNEGFVEFNVKRVIWTKQIPFYEKWISNRTHKSSCYFINNKEIPVRIPTNLHQVKRIIKKRNYSISYPYYYLLIDYKPNEYEIFQIPYNETVPSSIMVKMTKSQKHRRFIIEWSVELRSSVLSYNFWMYLIEIYDSNSQKPIDSYLFQCKTCSQQILERMWKNNKDLANTLKERHYRNCTNEFLAFEKSFKIETSELPINIKMLAKIFAFTESDVKMVKSFEQLSFDSTWIMHIGYKVLIGVLISIVIIVLLLCACFYLCRESPDNNKTDGPNLSNDYAME